MISVPDNIKKFFPEAIHKSIDDWDLTLPEQWVLGKIYRSEYYKYGMRGSRDLRFFIQMDKAGEYYIDYFFLTDDYTKHVRINSNGETERLENFLSDHSIKLTEYEARNEIIMKNFREHNEKINQIFIEKGLQKRLGDHSGWQ
jgi:hypothetical protein